MLYKELFNELLEKSKNVINPVPTNVENRVSS